jgi:hypothetical protein
VKPGEQGKGAFTIAKDFVLPPRFSDPSPPLLVRSIFEKKRDYKVSSATPFRNHRKSGVKSQVLKPTFLA